MPSLGLKSYFAPGSQKKDEKKGTQTPANPVEMAETPTISGAATPNFKWGGNSNFTSSPWGSRPASIYPVGDFRNGAFEEINEIKCDVMVNWLHGQQEERLWTNNESGEGVVLKKGRGQYTCSPPELMTEEAGFFKAVETLNVRVCFCRFAISFVVRF
jgi:hypothetical protein